MARIFTTILNMSLTASIIILIVLLARLCLKKAPKIYSYLLWAVVLFRLLCPVSFSMPVSVLAPVSESSTTAGTNYTASMEYISVPERPSTAPSQHEHGLGENTTPVNGDTAPVVTDTPAVVAPQQAAKKPAGEIALTILGWLWAAGMAAVLGFTTWQTFTLKRKLDTAFIIRGNIFESEHIDTAFILGVFNPKIYLPLDLPFDIQKAVVAHEQTHQRRGDHIVKLVSYLVLAVHWFNPLVWLSFKLMCDDMEKSCDEAVLREMNNRGYSMKSIKKAYGNMLLVLGGGKQHIFSPVSFAENSTKSRVKNVVAYNRIARNMGVGLAVVCVLIALLCVVNPTGAAAVVASDADVPVSGSEDKGSAEVERDPNAVQLTIGDVTFWSDVTELDLSGHELGDISALAQCTRLESLNLSETYVADISVLPQIPTLKHLNLSGNIVYKYIENHEAVIPSFSDWTPLSRCTGLLSLDVSDCSATELSFLHSLTELQELDISANNFYLYDTPTVDISVLARCTKLEVLNLSCRRVADISPLAQCTRLESLNLGATDVSDISVLPQIPTLKRLVLSSNSQISDWSQLGRCTNLLSLDLSYSGIVDLSILRSMTKLQELNLSNNNKHVLPTGPEQRMYFQSVKNEDVLSALTELRDLNLNELALDDISFVSSLAALEKLDVSGNYLSDISALNAHSNLKELCFTSNYRGFREGAPELVFPYGLTGLEELNAYSIEFSDLSGLVDCTGMKELILNSDTADLYFMSGMKKLEYLDLTSNVTDISALSNLSNLKHLILYTSLSYGVDLMPLKSLILLEELHIQNYVMLRKMNVRFYQI